MQDISLHLLDLIENSTRAGANLVQIEINLNQQADLLVVKVADDGCGMDEITAAQAIDPFYTSKLERIKKVGLGLPLFKQNAELAGGEFHLQSSPGNGTTVCASFGWSHLDRMPLGDVASSLITGILGHPETDFALLLVHKQPDGQVIRQDFDTRAVKAELEDIPITYPPVVDFVSTALNEMFKYTNLEEI